ncbi:alpha-L-arabinofuranosidase C-terminal domain-containing protein [Candidatus Halobonum tyrrellensis]|uniref:non-reducing end alpha-L-arabinofuranosidase n=1 Tax=Candidatus Halobonum tyrrellensis G22 TaxID=1324957 RepID=V4HP97_9EURY|nr:alpha-L-arabinofuranosidase C-terminal domain-containing protein [Candidatus Halobonum tyrrellensis]ESP89749.1 alpha-L-arabinofuranosidase domain-containing protein [Candidatus Halobonum tyrrellensis G22]
MADDRLFRHVDSGDPSEASVRIDPDSRGDPVEPMLFGKFCEHLGNNIYHGMDAQVLFNPVLGEWHFRAPEVRQSGGYDAETDPGRVRETVEAHGRPLAYPEETDSDALLEAYRDGLAFGWQPTDADAVTASPDTGPSGTRAQRIETDTYDEGVFQETRLPLHRTDGYEFRIRARASDETTLDLSVGPTGGAAVAEASTDVDGAWTTAEGTLALPSDADPDGVYEVRLTAADPANVVVDRVLLYPDDHVDGADPDVVGLLRESDLPLLRWPGGNFVSGYDWRDGVGPVDDRPTRINPAWGGLEYNLFGTAEFVEFCENVGCEPSICVNAGDGMPAEAAAWVEYCNGDPEETEMGALRAEHGYEEPFDVTYWEIGNELYGPWQVNWTTPAGNADRYARFREAMLDADPDIAVTACGLEVNGDGRWNDTLLEECGEDVRAVSEHVLAGGEVDATTDPDELFHAFMGFPDQLRTRFDDLRGRMEDAGVDDPKLDVTELQLFASFQPDAEGTGRESRHASDTEADGRGGALSPETMPTPTTISEALYDAVVRHTFIRMGGFVEMLTHSATVNHGGGLWKEGERVWANPCHYGRSIGSELAGKTPLGVEVTCDTIGTETTFREIDPVDSVPALDAMAAVGDDELAVVVVNRASRTESTDLAVDLGAFDTGSEGTVTVLSGESMADENTRDDPTRVVPESSSIPVEDGGIELSLDPYSMVRVTVPLE